MFTATLALAAALVASGPWKMGTGEVIRESGEKVSSAGYDDGGWLTAKVPGTVLGALVAAGKYPEPYYGWNNQKSRKLIPDLHDAGHDFYTAWFRTEIDIPADWAKGGVWMRPEGINYRGEIWLNGRLVSMTAGMFASRTVDVTRFVKCGARNVLAVKVRPVDFPGSDLQWVTKGMVEYANGGDGFIGRNVTMLMAIGWDFTWRDGVRDRNTGIWKNIVFFPTGDVRLDAPFVRAKLSDDLRSAELDVSVEVHHSNRDRWAERGDAKGTLEVEIPEAGVKLSREVKLSRGLWRDEHFAVKLDRPKLWWPVNKGEPNLYTLVARVKTARGEHELVRKFGVREITSDLSGEGGARQFYVNRRKIFIRGTNWIPETMLRTDDRRMEAELALTRQQGVNLVRLWGGGIVESDRFYELCDEMGLIVWQEFFMTGDTHHPDDRALYLANVADQIRRIRHHASVGHYVCSNESTEVPGIRDLIMKLDGTRGYQMQSECDGVHDGSPYFSLNPMRYYDDSASPRGSRVYGFNPEYGTAVLPSAEFLRTWFDEQDLWPINRKLWDYRDGGNGFYKMSTVHDALVRCYGEATSLEDYCRRSQAVDYHATRAIWEVWNRVRNGKGTGVLYWYNNTALPKPLAYGWDYSLEPTAALYATQNALEPLHAQYEYLSNVVSVTSDVIADHRVELTADVYDFESRKVWSKTATADVPAERCVDVFAVPFEALGLEKPHFLRLTLREAGREIASTFYWRSSDRYVKETPEALTGPCTAGFAALDDLPRTELKLAYDGQTAVVENTGAKIAFLTRLELKGPDGKALKPSRCSDNFFALLPGERRTVAMTHPAGSHTLTVSAWNAAAKTVAR